jgi:hypothetical protein
MNTPESSSINNVELIRSLTIDGTSSLYTCIGDYYINNINYLSFDINNARWTITDNSKLRIIEDNGINGCRVERIAFKSYDPDVFSSVEVYPVGETELTLEFEWNENFYSISKIITFGVTPQIEGIFELGTNQSIQYYSDLGYILDQMTPYYFSGNTEEQDDSSDIIPEYEYWWKVFPQGMPTFPSKYFGKDTKQRPVKFPEAGTYILSLSIIDGCGVSEKARQPIIVPESNLYSITPSSMTEELLFASLINQAQCKTGRGEVMFHDTRTGALVFQQSHDFCSSFSIYTHPIPGGLYLVRLVMNGQLIQQENIWVLHK